MSRKLLCARAVLANASKLVSFGSGSRESSIRLNFSEEIEESISDQISKELTAAYTYFAISSVFGNDTQALPGFHWLFDEFAKEELGHAKLWVDYLNIRGGKAKFKTVECVENEDWTPLKAVEKAIKMEKAMTWDLEKLRDLADKHCDYHFGKFVEDDFLTEQYDGLKKLGDLKTQIERVDDSFGLYMLDYNIFKKYKKKEKDE
ncbi:unnamed protein product [Nesidiocoris tenuis]|uniref:Ferritin n=2 Tax=Nesidiocoris tenuis TaxID=355587 RepID=A0A6H5GAG0_9HEMI|nr:Ferritin heavy chain [Nesidiocoris tenuis]CAA9999344.1 unnamed protein product [Nesidiocoris tenuis]CAB0002939.1 unnamed protein product [Nesidiocoris tenuis]